MSLPRSKRSDVWYSLLLVGGGAALAGLAATVLALQFYGMSYGTRVTVFYLAAPLAAALLGPCLWWWAIIKPGHLSVRRGIGVGVLGASLAHPRAWYIALVLAFFTGEQTVAGLLVFNPLQDLLASLLLAPFSLIYVGWITALVGGVAGGAIALLQSAYGCSGRWRAALSV
jgi:hypothetical protein